MRFSDRITFVNEGERYYDPEEGQYVDGEPQRTTVPCKLSTLGTERTLQIFGVINRKMEVARLQRPYTDDFDYVEINEQKYNVQRQSNYRKGVLFLESATT